MKIAMVTPTYYPIIGGTESTVQTLASKLDERGIHTDVITFNMNKTWEPICRWKIEEANSVKIIRIPALRSPTLNILTKKINPLEKLFLLHVIPQASIARVLKNYDIIHFHDDVDLSFPLFSHFVKKPKIFHFHTLESTYSFYKRNAFCKCLLRKLAQRYICNSNVNLKLLLDLGINREKILVIPNPINLEEFSATTYINDLHEYEKGINLDRNTKKVVYVSRLNNDKLIAIISTIKAASKIVQKIPNTQIILVGDGPCFDYVKMLTEKTNKHLNRKVVIMTGAIKDVRGMAVIMNLADVAVGVARVALEAMACGKPVIIADSILGPLGGNFGGIVTEENVTRLKGYNFSGRNTSERTTPDRIAGAVIKLLTNNKYRQSIGDFGRRFVKKEYDAQKIAEQLEGVYHSILENYKN